jgi:GT2 family glycosyltransferase
LITELYDNARQWLTYSSTFELVPLTNIQYEQDGSWHWSANKPQIKLLHNMNVPLKGYYMLEIEVANLKYSMNSCLYACKDREFNEDVMFTLPISRIASGPKTVKRICYFGDSFSSFRFGPSDEEGACGALSIRLIKLTSRKAKQLMLKKLSTNIFNYETDQEVIDIYREYNAVFSKINVVNYESWINKHEVRDEVSRREATRLIDCFEIRPLISIVCPVYNTKPAWLVACVESVKNQLYSNWELILVDDASTNSSHFDILTDYDAEDSRINIVFLEKNIHISAATNVGIDLSMGDYVAFLDHDDELAPNALFELCMVINAQPNAKIIYSDEDLMSESGERVAPHFKSDWNPELLRAHNYITHFCCYEASLLKLLGGMRLGYEGAQDYDLILRASAITEGRDIYHIAKILYHWRMVEGSTALSSDAKSYATEAGLKALRDYIDTNNVAASVANAEYDNFYTLGYFLPDALPKVSIIIPTRDGMEVLKPCIESLIEKTNYSNYEVIILDNDSKEEDTLDFLRSLSLKANFKIVRDNGEFNYSRINNLAVKNSTGDLICLLNNDIEIITNNWLSEMVSIAIREEVGCVGAKLLYPDGTVQHAGVILGLGGYAAHSHRGLAGNASGYFCRAQIRQQLSAVTGACLVVKRSTYDAVGGLDEAFQVAYNDVDFCLRVQALGFKNIYTPFAELIHHESKTRGEDNNPEKTKRFEQEKALLLTTWGPALQNDPFYNINLTRSREDFSIGELHC